MKSVLRDSVCAVAAVFPDGSVDVVRETIEGRIAHESAGTHGFGYDAGSFIFLNMAVQRRSLARNKKS